MIRNLIRLALAVLMAAAFGTPGLAETASPAPRLKELVTVSSEIVRIGDQEPVVDPGLIRRYSLGHCSFLPVWP